MEESFEYLLDLYFRGDATAEQTERLMEWIRKGDYDEHLQQFMDEAWERVDQRKLREERAEAILQTILAGAGKVVHMDAPPARPFKIRWWMTAAAALLIFVAGYWLLTPNGQGPELAQSPAPVKADISPGKDAAILTLADGRQVLLDSATGTISTDNGVQIINVKGLLSYAGENKGKEAAYHTITTARGNQYQLQLEDGTKVWLNSASSLRYPVAFTGKERRVELSGEGYFEVAHHAARPFYVKVGAASPAGREMEVQVLGTHFNINAYTDEPSVKTTLLEGAVAVKVENERVKIKPGEQAILMKDEKLKIENGVDLDAVVAWKNGMFYLKGANVKEIMRQVSRWYDLEVVYKGDVRDVDFYGVVSRRKDLSELLRVMEKTGIVKFSVEGNRVTVSK